MPKGLLSRVQGWHVKFDLFTIILILVLRHDDFYLKLPNLNMRQIFVEYFNELHRIDVSTKYAEMMQGFIDLIVADSRGGKPLG